MHPPPESWPVLAQLYDNEDEEIQEMMKIPWCAAILKKHGTIAGTMRSGPLWAETWAGRDAVPAAVFGMVDPVWDQDGTHDAPQKDAAWLPMTTCYVVAKLEQGVCNLFMLVHGGVISGMLDEVMGLLCSSNKSAQSGLFQLPSVEDDYWAPGKGRHEGMLNLSDKITLTTGLNIAYHKALRAPCVVKATARIKKIEGRKICLEADIRDESDVVYATAESIFFTVQSKL